MFRKTRKGRMSSWIYLGITVFTVSLVEGLFQVYGIFLAVFVEFYKESNTNAGWVGSLAFFLTLFAYPLAVFLRRQFGFRFVILCTAVLIFFAFISTPFMTTMTYLFITFSAPFGIAVGFLDCLSIITLPDYFDDYLGFATGIRSASISLGAIMFGYLLPILIDSLGWKKTFFTCSSLGAVCVVYSMAYHPPLSRKQEKDVILAEDQEIVAAAEISRKARSSYGFLRNKEFMSILIGSLLFVSVVGIPSMFIIQYAKTLGYPYSKSKWLLVSRSFASLFSRVGMGRIADFALRRRKIRHIVQVTVMLFGITSGLCSLTQSFPLLILYMGSIGCLEGIYWMIQPLMMIEVTSGEDTDYALAVVLFVMGFGYLGGPPAMGWFYDMTGDFRDVLYAVSACAMIAGVTMAIGSCVASKRDHAVTHDDKNDHERKRGLKTNELNDFNLLEMMSVPVLPMKQTITMVEYESAV